MLHTLLLRLRACKDPMRAWLAAWIVYRDAGAEAIEYFRRESAAGRL